MSRVRQQTIAVLRRLMATTERVRDTAALMGNEAIVAREEAHIAQLRDRIAFIEADDEYFAGLSHPSRSSVRDGA